MKNMWKKHIIGKRILAFCLLATMLFDTVTASAVTLDEDSTQIDVVEEGTEVQEASEEENLGEEIVEESDASEIEEIEESDTMGIFEDVDIQFSGYTAIVRGTFIPKSDEEFYEINVVSYNESGEVLFSTGRPGMGTVILGNNHNYFPASIAKNTSYVRLEAISESSEHGYEPAYSDKFFRTTEPDFSLEIEEMSVGEESLILSTGYIGDLGNTDDTALCYITAELMYGTSEDESTWNNLSYASFTISATQKGGIIFRNLESKTTLYGKVRFYFEIYDPTTDSNIINYEQTVLLEPFETEQAVIYNLKTMFPDAVLRDWLINRINIQTGSDLTEDSEVTSAQLASISGTLYLNRDNLSAEPVRDITGIDLLTNVTDIYLNHNEIEMIDHIDWSKLTKLKEIYIRGNNITCFPDFSKNEKLTWINFDDNMLSEEEQKTVSAKLPANARYSINLFSSQRSSLVELKMEENYYVYDSKVPFVAVVGGQKEYAAKLYIDGVERMISPNWDDDILIEDSGLTVGAHTAKVELYNGDVKERETEELTFYVVEENVFVEDDLFYVYCEDNYFYPDFYSVKPLESVCIVDDSGNVYATTYAKRYEDICTSDPRYENQSLYIPGINLYWTGYTLESEYDVLPAGLYHVKVTYADGITETICDKVQIIEHGQPFYKDAYITDEYNAISKEYLYVVIGGWNLELDKFDYVVTKENTELPVTFVDVEEQYNGEYVVRLRKEGWNNYRNSSIELLISPKEGYAVYGSFKPIYDWDNGTLSAYMVYNDVLKKLEVALDDAYLNETVSVVLREGQEEGCPVIATGSTQITDDIVFIDLYNPDGSRFVPSAVSYYCEATIGDESYADWIDANRRTIAYNYWDGRLNIKERTSSTTLYFYSDIPYSGYGEDAINFSVKVEGEGAEFIGTIKAKTDSWDEDCTRIALTMTTRNLPKGSYTVKVCDGEIELGSETLFVYDTKEFILDTVFAGWVSESELKIQLEGANLVNSSPTITVYDEDGNAVEGLMQRNSYRDTYGDVLRITLTGLNRSDAEDKYYIKVSSRRLEGPYRRNGELYYSENDTYGELVSIFEYSGSSYKVSEQRISGICVGKDIRDAVVQAPLTIRVYKPYNKELVRKIEVTSGGQFRYNRESFAWEYNYYFNKTFWESLPNRDATYEVVVECDGEVLGSYTGVLGYEEWYYSVESEELYLDSKGAKTTTLYVKNYGETPTIVSSDTSVAKLKISEDYSGEVTITAVKTGTTEIIITADGITKSFTLTVKNLPKIKAKSSVVLNSFFDTPRVDLEITNSWDAEVTSVYMSESVDGLDVVQTVDGKWYLRWYKEAGAIPKNTKITLNFEVEGYSATEEDPIPTQTITVNTKSTQPTVVLSEDVIEFKAYPYKDKKIDFTVKNSDYSGRFALNPSDVVLSKAPEEVDIENPGVAVAYDEISGKLLVTASNDAENGVYEFVITPTVEDNSEDVKRARPVILKVKLSGKEPAFTFNTSSVTLDAAYPGESEASIKLLMDEGYVVEEAVITAPNKDVEEFISVESNEDGTFTFKLEKVGIASAGTYKIKVKVRASWGTVYEMKPLNVTVKVSNSSKVTLSSKSKSVTINQNVGSAEVKANLAVKGFAKQNRVDYTTEYEFIPTNEPAKNASIDFKVDENGAIKITDCKGYGDGKYTYNVVGIIAGTDGTITYTKPLAFAVQLKAKMLTIVPARSSVTVYSEYCSIKNGCYVVEIPVSVKESSEIKLDASLTNSMEDKDVLVEFNQDGSKIIVEFPTKVNKVSNLIITPDDVRFNTFKVSITVKTADAKAAFSAKTVTLDRYTDEEVSNTVVDTEGYVIDSLSSIIVKDKKKKDVTEQFVVNTDRNVLTIGIASEYVDKIANGEYTVSVIPAINIDDDMEPKELAACTFKLKLTQPKLKVSIGEQKKASQTVNLYPTLGELESDAFEMNVYSGTVPLSISKVEIALTSKDKKKEVAEARLDDENRIILSAIEDEEGAIKNGKNTFIVKVYVKKANGEEDILADTLEKAFVVNVRDLPKNIVLAKTKLTYSPYVESNVTTTIKSAELETLMQTGDYSYVISAEETTSKHKELAEDKKNRILEVSGSADGVITVDNVGIPTKNATYYYKLTVDFIQNDTDRIVASYPVKMSVSVKNTLPKATLQMSSISLDNAFVKQEVANKVILSTGTGLWKLDALSDVDIIVKSGKKDVTGEGYFDISYDGTGFNVSLNNRDANERLMTVPKGTYKIIITPNVSEKNAEIEEGLKSPLKPLTLTVKVTSSRPTVKVASKVTVKAGDEAKVLEPVLKNKGTLTAMMVECKPPKKATEEDVAGIEVTLLEDGMISVKAEKDVLPGSYKFTINPVTRIDGEEILLAPISITVTVKK